MHSSAATPGVHLIAAARPNFMKVAPLFHALKDVDWCEVSLVHTGQHYDFNMSDAFFRDLMLPEPDVHLGVGSGSHAEQTGAVMAAYERVLLEQMPRLVVVVGDVNSTMACTIAAVKTRYESRDVPFPLVAHLEAGLRSFDRDMPEEINRLVTDALAHRLWTPSPDGDAHLLREGVAPERIERVGNIMIDAFEMLRERIEAVGSPAKFGLSPQHYGVVTLHRPSNVDDPESLGKLVSTLVELSENLSLVFPVHPRTRKNLEKFGLLARLEEAPGVVLSAPLGYIEFMGLVVDARVAVTDSGGLQEETTYLGIPCLTLRANTERPITVTAGTNQLCTVDSVGQAFLDALQQPLQQREPPELWDGQTAARVRASIAAMLGVTA